MIQLQNMLLLMMSDNGRYFPIASHFL